MQGGFLAPILCELRLKITITSLGLHRSSVGNFMLFGQKSHRIPVQIACNFVHCDLRSFIFYGYKSHHKVSISGIRSIFTSTRKKNCWYRGIPSHLPPSIQRLLFIHGSCSRPSHQKIVEGWKCNGGEGFLLKGDTAAQGTHLAERKPCPLCLLFKRMVDH